MLNWTQLDYNKIEQLTKAKKKKSNLPRTIRFVFVLLVIQIISDNLPKYRRFLKSGSFILGHLNGSSSPCNLGYQSTFNKLHPNNPL